MRRYIFGYDVNSITERSFDVVVVGSGIAGLYAAMHIDPRLSVAIVTKDDSKHSNSYYAQGGIAAVMSKDDSYQLHIEDTLEAGAGLCDREAVEVLVSDGPDNIRALVEMNVPFDVNAEGELMITREGGHRQRRIVHCGGDATGRQTTRRLAQIAMERKNITLQLNTYFIDVLTDDKGVYGAVVFDESDDKPMVLFTRHVIIATGGIGQVYQYTTNPRGAVGDGISAAARAGAVIENMELVQFHPTTLMPHYESDRLFLISEAVRGEGGILRDRAGKAFMQGQHIMADLAPRDIVTRCIYKELRASGDPCVYLDVSTMSKEFFSERFPTIFNECAKFNINLTEDFIPVRPAQHYLMGGIKTDTYGLTNIKGLYSCGESASTGIHGANRLASNSMLECLVFSRRCAIHINENHHAPHYRKVSIYSEEEKQELMSEQIQGFRQEIKTIMSQFAGAIRTSDGLEFAHERLGKIQGFLEGKQFGDYQGYELYNMTQAALMIINGALERKGNVGAHYVMES